MNQERKEPVSFGSVLLAGAVFVGLMVWRALSYKRPAKEVAAMHGTEKLQTQKSVTQMPSPSANEKPPVKPESRPLPSLSSNQPNELPLDRMKHIADAEPHLRPEPAPAIPAPTVAASDNIQSIDEILRTQSLDAAPLPGWSIPAPGSIPLPTFAPAIMAMGILFVAMGFVSKWYVGVVGAVIFAVAAWRWVEELQGD